MTDVELQEDLPPVAHVTIVYTGPIAPHWDLRVRYGDQKLVDDFWARVNARLLLLPKHDPQFRRNKERVNRDAERERITCDWDLGEDDADTTITPVADSVPAEASPSAEPVSDVAPEPAPESAPAAGDPAADTESAPAADTGAEDADADADAGDAAAEDGQVESQPAEQPAEI